MSRPIKKKRYAMVQVHDERFTHGSYDPQCIICLEPYEDGDRLRKLKCKHVFHDACISQWRLRANTCPKCRNEVVHKSIKLILCNKPGGGRADE